MEKKYKTVAVAGHFNPLHSGHLKMFREAKKLGDRLVVILANDEQTKNKIGATFMSYNERVKILRALKIVDKVIPSVDTNSDVALTLRLNRNDIDIFASGCSRRHKDTLPERYTCEKHGIKTVYNVGGDKIQSSSNILKKFRALLFQDMRSVRGNVEFYTPDYFPLQFGVHEPKEDRISKLHKHASISEWLYVERGQIEITTTDENFKHPVKKIMKKGDSVLLFGAGHSVKLPKGCRVLEIKSGYANDKIYA